LHPAPPPRSYHIPSQYVIFENQEDFIGAELLQTDLVESTDYLTKQIITYIGNKRALLDFIGKGVHAVQKKLGKSKLNIFDVFSGSGIVARHFKQYANQLLVNDLEAYSKALNECYLSNTADLNIRNLRRLYNKLLQAAAAGPLKAGIISEYYAPKDDDNIEIGERVFYTRRNAMYIDTMNDAIKNTVSEKDRKYFLAPLLVEASIHANTSGVFKGFYKDRHTRIGQFGGSAEDALARIKGEINLPFPIFSNFNCDVTVFNDDANKIYTLHPDIPEVDLAYLDPPYNQHPYGSNYFMLNLILKNKLPERISKVSGIPDDWNRSCYNKKKFAHMSLTNLVTSLKAKYVLISFNSEGFITPDEMKIMLRKFGKVDVLETPYNTFRGSRNLRDRAIHITESLYLLEKR
jgi:adenine-specific DNA-methyltransferase